ncbi:hypothetical protein U1Q18_051982 [Sarracenia purpurea var. burkii]
MFSWLFGSSTTTARPTQRLFNVDWHRLAEERTAHLYMDRLQAPDDDDDGHVAFTVSIAERFPPGAARMRLLFPMTNEELVCSGSTAEFTRRASQLIHANRHQFFVDTGRRRRGATYNTVYLVDHCDHWPYVMWARWIHARPVGLDTTYYAEDCLVVALWDDRRRRWASRMLVCSDFPPTLPLGRGIPMHLPDVTTIELPTAAMLNLPDEPHCTCGGRRGGGGKPGEDDAAAAEDNTETASDGHAGRTLLLCPAPPPAARRLSATPKATRRPAALLGPPAVHRRRRQRRRRPAQQRRQRMSIETIAGGAYDAEPSIALPADPDAGGGHGGSTSDPVVLQRALAYLRQMSLLTGGPLTPELLWMGTIRDDPRRAAARQPPVARHAAVWDIIGTTAATTTTDNRGIQRGNQPHHGVHSVHYNRG